MPSPGSPPKTGLSTTSLVLGILGTLCLGIFTGIPAIITGHIARSRALKRPLEYGGAGLALAGLILGYLSIPATLVGAGLVLPALAKAKARAQQISCVNNLKHVALGARIYAQNHNDTFPPDYKSMADDLMKPKVLVCPSDGSRTVAPSFAQFSEAENVSYEYLAPNAKASEIGNQITFRCPVHGNEALGDGSVRMTTRRRR